MLKAQSSTVDLSLTHPTGIRARHSKYGLISLGLYMINWHNGLTSSEIQLLFRNTSLGRMTHGNTSYKGFLAETQGGGRGSESNTIKQDASGNGGRCTAANQMTELQGDLGNRGRV